MTQTDYAEDSLISCSGDGPVYSTPSSGPTTLFTLVNTSSHSPSLSESQVMAPPAPRRISAVSAIVWSLTVAIDHHGPDHHTQIHLSVQADIAQCTAVDSPTLPSLDAFEKLHTTQLRSASHAARRKASPHRLDRAHIPGKLTTNSSDEIVYAVRLECDQFWHDDG